MCYQVKKYKIVQSSQCLKITQNVAFEFWHFPPIFDLLKLTCLVTLFDRKLQVFKNSPKWTIFGIFNQLLSTQNVNVARFARNVEWDFFCDFQTLWTVEYLPKMPHLSFSSSRRRYMNIWSPFHSECSSITPSLECFVR